MAENRHIFNNLTQVEKIKPKIDNPIIVEDVTYNFSDLIENEWISHFPQYSHRMRSTFVKGAGIVDEHLANINQCLIQLEDELYRVYDKLSDDKKAEVTEFIQARQNEVNTFIQARKDEVASFISDRKSEVANFIKDRKNEVATFISDKQHLVDEFVQARQNEVANFIQSKTNEVSNYINQKEEQITRFIENKDNEIKRRTDTLDDYTKNLEGKIDQFNLVIQGGEATEDKLGLIKLSTISEQVQVATVENLKKALITPNFKDTTPVKWSVNITVQYSKKEKKIVVDNLNKTKLDYVFDSSNYSEFANCRKRTETITRADEEVKNVDKVICLKLKQVIVKWHVISEGGKINKIIEEVVPTQYIPFIYRFDPSKYPELGGYVTSEDSNSINIDDEGNELLECIAYLILRTEPPAPEPEPKNPSGGGTGNHQGQEDKVITQKDVEDKLFNTKEEIEAELKSLKEKGVSTRKLKVNDKVYLMGLVKEFKALINKEGNRGSNYYKKIDFYNGHSQYTTLISGKRYILNNDKFKDDPFKISKFEWLDGTEDILKCKIHYSDLQKQQIYDFYYNLSFIEGLEHTREKDKNDILKEESFTKEFFDFQMKWRNGIDFFDESINELMPMLEEIAKMEAHFSINGIETPVSEEIFPILLYPIIEDSDTDDDRP